MNTNSDLPGCVIRSGRAARLFGGEFELVDSGFQSGQYNMDFDTRRMTDLSLGKVLPMLRLYGWAPYAVSLGAHQSAAEIDIEKCRQFNFDIVRRPTGGRAVLHANELTYCAVVRMDAAGTAHDFYRELHQLLISALEAICPGQLEFEKSQPDFRDFYKSSQMSVSCFASSARYEVVWRGRKLIGSAQRLYGDVLLQHGSILLGSGHERLADVVSGKDEPARNMLKEYIMGHSATLEQVCGRAVTYDECRHAIVQMVAADF